MISLWVDLGHLWMSTSCLWNKFLAWPGSTAPKEKWAAICLAFKSICGWRRKKRKKRSSQSSREGLEKSSLLKRPSRTETETRRSVTKKTKKWNHAVGSLGTRLAGERRGAESNESRREQVWKGPWLGLNHPYNLRRVKATKSQAQREMRLQRPVTLDSGARYWPTLACFSLSLFIFFCQENNASTFFPLGKSLALNN